VVAAPERPPGVMLSFCAQPMLATQMVVRQIVNALGLDRFMFTLLANPRKNPRHHQRPTGISFEIAEHNAEPFPGKRMQIILHNLRPHSQTGHCPGLDVGILPRCSQRTLTAGRVGGRYFSNVTPTIFDPMVHSRRCGVPDTSMIWTILGVSVAIIAVFCVSVAELLVGHPIFERSRGYIALTFAVSGIVAWFIGRFLARRRLANETEDEIKVFVLFDLRYWGPMFVALGVITLFIDTIKMREKSVGVAAAPAPPKKIEPVVVVEPPPAPRLPVNFPAVKLQGIIFREDHPAVIVNGRSYEEGDSIGDMTIKEITREAVKFEKSGEEKLFFLAGDPRGGGITPAGK
jgi:hypothetical protein